MAATVQTAAAVVGTDEVTEARAMVAAVVVAAERGAMATQGAGAPAERAAPVASAGAWERLVATAAVHPTELLPCEWYRRRRALVLQAQ